MMTFPVLKTYIQLFYPVLKYNAEIVFGLEYYCPHATD